MRMLGKHPANAHGKLRAAIVGHGPLCSMSGEICGLTLRLLCVLNSSRVPFIIKSLPMRHQGVGNLFSTYEAVLHDNRISLPKDPGAKVDAFS